MPAVTTTIAAAAAAIPVWVPALLLGLVWLGWRQVRPRVVRPVVVGGLALGMFGYSLAGVVAAFGVDATALAAWGAGYAAMLALGAAGWAPRGLQRLGRQQVHMPGSWVPMGLLLTVFAARFALGTVVAMRSPLLADAGFVAAVCALLGAASGGFGLRALAVQRCASQAAAAGTPASGMVATPAAA